MKDFDATEIAYKNGYNQALEDFAERLFACDLDICLKDKIDYIAKEIKKD